MKIEKYSIGIGDRFGREGNAQLAAIQEINTLGIPVVPVWNKSYREHKIVKTTHAAVRREADDAVAAMHWKNSYYVDADHIQMENVDEFIAFSNFFTIDVAHFISTPVDNASKEDFIRRYSSYIGKLTIPGIDEVFKIDRSFLSTMADNYFMAIQEVKKIYNYIAARKGKENFIPEVSMDETHQVQSPVELFFILAELNEQRIDVQTIAPKFSGLFAKGIDYIGDIGNFSREFEQDVAVVDYAIETLGMPESLKLSIHSGSDKFSIYPTIQKALKKFNAGIHVKTAGTTWLEEVIGLARSGGYGLEIAKKIYRGSLDRYDELTAPYASVLKIDKSRLPSAEKVMEWSTDKFALALIHNQQCREYNPDFRQLIHVGYKIAAELGDEYTSALDNYKSEIEKNVKYNLLERHLKLLFQ
jgi:tagaturonate epimerase